MIDSHAHLDMEAFDADREDVLHRARDAGVDHILSLGMIDEDDAYQRAFPILDANPDFFTAIGCHPHDARLFDEKGGEALVERLADRPRLVAIGEIGLDYHYDNSPRPVQQDVFRRQIRVARKLELPVIVHQRESEEDLRTILEEEKAGEFGGILHSFTADLQTAEYAIAHNFLVSFSGIVTFKSAQALRDVARELPLDKLLVETDCPYLAPVPHRGKRNEPAFVVVTARVLADIKGVSLEEIERRTDENFRRLFRL
jgi:TatD DNase family protein